MYFKKNIFYIIIINFLFSFPAFSERSIQDERNAAKLNELVVAVNSLDAPLFISTDKSCLKGGDKYEKQFSNYLRWPKKDLKAAIAQNCDKSKFRVYHSCYMTHKYLGLSDKFKFLFTAPYHQKDKLKIRALKKELPRKLVQRHLKQCTIWHSRVYGDVRSYLTKKEQAKIAKDKNKKIKKAKRLRLKKVKLEKLALKNKKFKNRLNTALTTFSKPGIEIIMWPDTTYFKQERLELRNVTKYKNIENMFNNLNISLDVMKTAVYDNARSKAGISSSQQPKKGEFEKTDDYKQRLVVEREKHDVAIINAKKIFQEDLPASRSRVFNQYLGKPIITSIDYLADNEYFLVTIKSDNSPYKITGKYTHPITTAKEQKTKLSTSKPNISFSLSNGIFEPKVALLIVDNELVNLSDLSFTKSLITFGPSSAVKWKIKQDKERKYKEAKRKKEQEESAIQQKKERDARRNKYNHSGPFLSPESIVCTDYYSVTKALILISTNNPYVKVPVECAHFDLGFMPLRKVEGMSGGVSKIIFIDGTRAFVLTKSVVD